jgi:hypothetical protein
MTSVNHQIRLAARPALPAPSVRAVPDALLKLLAGQNIGKLMLAVQPG